MLPQIAKTQVALKYPSIYPLGFTGLAYDQSPINRDFQLKYHLFMTHIAMENPLQFQMEVSSWENHLFLWVMVHDHIFKEYHVNHTAIHII